MTTRILGLPTVTYKRIMARAKGNGISEEVTKFAIVVANATFRHYRSTEEFHHFCTQYRSNFFGVLHFLKQFIDGDYIVNWGEKQGKVEFNTEGIDLAKLYGLNIGPLAGILIKLRDYHLTKTNFEGVDEHALLYSILPAIIGEEGWKDGAIGLSDGEGNICEALPNAKGVRLGVIKLEKEDFLGLPDRTPVLYRKDFVMRLDHLNGPELVSLLGTDYDVVEWGILFPGAKIVNEAPPKSSSTTPEKATVATMNEQAISAPMNLEPLPEVPDFIQGETRKKLLELASTVNSTKAIDAHAKALETVKSLEQNLESLLMEVERTKQEIASVRNLASTAESAVANESEAKKVAHAKFSKALEKLKTLHEAQSAVDELLLT